MALLFVDTETTNLPTPREPAHLCQLAAALTDDEGLVWSEFCFTIRPTRMIDAGASRVHGITHEIADRFGVPEVAAIGALLRLATKADTLVAFNAPFDVDRLEEARARLLQAGHKLAALPAKTLCVMTLADRVMKLPPTERMIAAGFSDKTKPPKLEEAFKHFVGRPMKHAHNAGADVRATIEVWKHVRSAELDPRALAAGGG